MLQAIHSTFQRIHSTCQIIYFTLQPINLFMQGTYGFYNDIPESVCQRFDATIDLIFRHFQFLLVNMLQTTYTNNSYY